MRLPAKLPPGLMLGPFGLQDALELGVPKGRLRRRDLTIPYRGVRAPRMPSGVLERALAYAPRLAPSHFFSHWTAAELLGMRIPEGFRPPPSKAAPLHVSSLPPGRAPRALGIVGHQLVVDVTVVRSSDGLVMSAPVDTWCQLAAGSTVDDLVVLGDGLVCRQNPTATLVQLRQAVDAWAGRPGAERLRLAVPSIRQRTDSARETMLRLVIVAGGLPEPDVNPKILNALGAFIAFGDLTYFEYRVLVEYDGAGHLSPEQVTKDIARLEELMDEGWRVIRVDKYLFAKRATLLGKIRAALIAGGWPADGPVAR